MRWVIRVGRVGAALFALLGLIETIQGAPEAVDALSKAGVASPQMLGIVLSAIVVLILGLVALGPHRVRHWLSSILGEPVVGEVFQDPIADLRAWLDERIKEIHGIKKQFIALLARSIPSYDEMQMTLSTFWGVNDDVIRRLHQDAPDALQAYALNPDWYDTTLVRSSREECEEVVRLFDYTIDQLAHIRAYLEPTS